MSLEKLYRNTLKLDVRKLLPNVPKLLWNQFEISSSSLIYSYFYLLFWLQIFTAKVFYRKHGSHLGQWLQNESENRDTIRVIFSASHFADEFAYVLLCRAICFSKVRFSLAFYLRNLVFFSSIGGTGYSRCLRRNFINSAQEYINVNDVITFCLYLMNKMRRNLIKIRSCAIFQMDDVIVYFLSHASYPYLGMIMSKLCFDW